MKYDLPNNCENYVHRVVHAECPAEQITVINFVAKCSLPALLDIQLFCQIAIPDLLANLVCYHQSSIVIVFDHLKAAEPTKVGRKDGSNAYVFHGPGRKDGSNAYVFHGPGSR